MRDRQTENSYPMNTALRSGAEAPAEAAIMMPSSIGTVLLVEDEEGIREVTAMLLSHLKYSVICAACAADAIEKFRKHQGSVDVLLTDVVMPGMNGLKLAETLAAMDPDLKIIIMSGYPGKDGSEETNVPFLQKPFTSEKLAKAMHEVMDNKARECPLH
ncbi:MAG TPA: response regulator [Candidatus Angelobacter sp.]|jgi:DNA-binding NtrC family response regulator|nr:response regulator [Candidatus Angelobacter sp.]